MITKKIKLGIFRNSLEEKKEPFLVEFDSNFIEF